MRIVNVFGVTTEYLIRDSVPVDAMQTVQAHGTSRSFGEVLRELRQEAGLTQKQLVAHLGTLTQGHLSVLEHGTKQPSLALVVQLADFFGMTTDRLLRDV